VSVETPIRPIWNPVFLLNPSNRHISPIQMKCVLLEVEPQVSDNWLVKPHWGQVGLRSPVTHSSHLWRSNGWNKHQSVSTWTQWESFHPITFCFLSFVTTQTDASVVLCKSCPHRSSSSGSRNTTIVVTWSLVIQKYLCVPESLERTFLKKVLIGVARHDTNGFQHPDPCRWWRTEPCF